MQSITFVLFNMQNHQSIFRRSRIIYPVLIGTAAATWLVIRNFDKDAFGFFHWTWAAGFWLLGALGMMLLRDLAYMIRLRVLTNKELGWKQSFQVIMLWEFSSAVSPSVVGGVGPAIWFLYKEGLNSGKSTAVVLTSIFLDEVFFILLVPAMYWFFKDMIFPMDTFGIANQVQWILIFGYVVIFIYTGLLAYALFVNPYSFKCLISRVFMLPVLRKRRLKARKLANQLIITSKQIRGKSMLYWIKAFLSTSASWFGRYAVVNFIFMAFFFSTLNLFDHALIIARQLTMWIILLVSPTPGGSGVAELIFSDFLGDLIPNVAYAIPLALLWRLISFYPYLFMGAFILPGWIKKVFSPSYHYRQVR